MKQETKRRLAEYWEPPKPLKKEAFVRCHRRPELHLTSMLKIQIHYIPGSIWLLSVILFGTMLAAQLKLSAQMFSAVYAMVPFLVTVTLTAGNRSCRYGMAEMEQAAPFSLKSVWMTRMLLLGVGNLGLILLLALLKKGIFLEELLYLLVPYLVTASGGIFCYRRVPGREGNYCCFGISILVSLGQMILRGSGASFYQSNHLGYWAVVMILCILFLSDQIKKMMRQMEDMAWS